MGLEYNVDYVDASKEKAKGRRVKDNSEKKVLKTEKDEISENAKEKTEEIPEKKEIEKDNKTDSSNKKDNNIKEEIDIDSDDNLFDLIDSMYQEND